MGVYMHCSARGFLLPQNPCFCPGLLPTEVRAQILEAGVKECNNIHAQLARLIQVILGKLYTANSGRSCAGDTHDLWCCAAVYGVLKIQGCCRVHAVLEEQALESL